MSRSIYLGLSLVLLTGCADNPYAKTYQPGSESVLRTVAQRREHPVPGTPPELVQGTDPKKDLAGLCLEGYVVIGQSRIRGATVSDAQAIAHAKAVGADRVLVYRQPGSTVTSGTTTPLGPNGPAIISGSATTTTFGADPMSNAPATARYDTLAIFLVKEKPAFGATCGQLGPF